MRNRVTVMLAAGAAVIASAVFVGPASAAPATWTIDPGGGFTGTAGETVLEIEESGIQLFCESAGAVGTAKSGSGNSNPLATIDSTTFNVCSGPLGLEFEVTHVGSWELHGASYDAGTGVTTGTIQNIVADIDGIGCDAQVTGTVNGTYTNSTHLLAVDPGFTLDVSYVNPDPDFNCFGLINEGEHAGFNGVYDVSPALTISMQP